MKKTIKITNNVPQNASVQPLFIEVSELSCKDKRSLKTADSPMSERIYEHIEYLKCTISEICKENKREMREITSFIKKML